MCILGVTNLTEYNCCLFLDLERVPKCYERRSCSCACCYQIFDSLKLCQYATGRNQTLHRHLWPYSRASSMMVYMWMWMVCILVPPKPAKFSVFADDHGNVYFNWTLVSSASSYTIYWCHHHVHVQQCAVCLSCSVSFFVISCCRGNDCFQEYNLIWCWSICCFSVLAYGYFWVFVFLY